MDPATLSQWTEMLQTLEETRRALATHVAVLTWVVPGAWVASAATRGVLAWPVRRTPS